jgi:hypothetical protein
MFACNTLTSKLLNPFRNQIHLNILIALLQPKSQNLGINLVKVDKYQNKININDHLKTPLPYTKLYATN